DGLIYLASFGQLLLIATANIYIGCTIGIWISSCEQSRLFIFFPLKKVSGLQLTQNQRFIAV
ncbi:MAG: hypothetical protein ACKPH7_01145, partial [Planktothrix sp.]|uniref:hypothetical protein n=1 Tax=Planktothrix sp. TaxID=3088171 RepID=UPI0038D3C30C